MFGLHPLTFKKTSRQRLRQREDTLTSTFLETQDVRPNLYPTGYPNHRQIQK